MKRRSFLRLALGALGALASGVALGQIAADPFDQFGEHRIAVFRLAEDMVSFPNPAFDEVVRKAANALAADIDRQILASYGVIEQPIIRKRGLNDASL